MWRFLDKDYKQDCLIDVIKLGIQDFRGLSNQAKTLQEVNLHSCTVLHIPLKLVYICY